MNTLPDRDEMIAAFMSRDSAYDGIFLTAVRTTGIFCRPTCPARKPKEENVEFYRATSDALVAGFRPCKRCRPMETDGTPPNWLRPLLEAVERDPQRRWKDLDLRRLGVQPERVRRWFKRYHGITFHAYNRARRVGAALGQIKHGDTMTGSAFDSGFESLSGFAEAVKKMAGASPAKAAQTRTVVATRIPTPLGLMVAGALDDAICLLEFADRPMLPAQMTRVSTRLHATIVPGSNAVIDQLAIELEQYFEGSRKRFDVAIRQAGTPFQERVWDALRAIPVGSTKSYSEIAGIIGQPTAVRAVARANGDNRIAILIPCHRVIGVNGDLTGYGGGLWRKRRLLEIEKS